MKNRIVIISIFVILFSLCFGCIFYILGSDDIRKNKEALNIVVLTKKANTLSVTNESLKEKITGEQKSIEELSSSIANIDIEIEGATKRLATLGK